MSLIFQNLNFFKILKKKWGGGGGGGWGVTVVGVLVAGKALGNVAASGGSEGRLASKAGDCRRGKRGTHHHH